MKAFVYGDVSPNIIDGSSIWLGSMVTVLSDVVDEVHILLKYKPTTNVITSAFTDRPNVIIHDPRGRLGSMRVDGGHSPASAAAQFESLCSEYDFDLAVVRGLQACLAFSDVPKARELLWSYVTDLPFPPENLTASNCSQLEQIARGSRRMLAQTEAARSYLEGIAPASAGRTLLMPPMIPDFAFSTRDVDTDFTQGLSLVYSGKFAREWRTDHMLDLPNALRARGQEATLNVIGSKFQASKQCKGWHDQMRTKLETLSEDASNGVIWHGGVDRRRSIELISSADLGIGWRTRDLDSSLEISTKALEYGAAGVPPIVNRTADHERLYGRDYPFFVTSNTTVDELADLIVTHRNQVSFARQRAARVSSSHSMEAVRNLWRKYLATAFLQSPTPTETSRPTRVLVVSHDFKFLGEIIDILEADSAVELATNRWTSLHTHDEAASKAHIGEADVVFCEWAGPNLVWCSRNKRPGQKLVARLHGFELRGGKWLSDVDFEAVDTLVFVSDFYRARALAELPLREEQTMTIPNMIDCADLDRPKNSNAAFTLGLAGYVPYLKRPDHALDLLEALLQEDHRYTLLIKGRPPWEYPHHWNNRLQRACYLDFFGRIRESPRLRDAVRFDPFSPDIASWLRNVGFVLSPSDHESFHMAPAEGMASGAVPLVWKRDGAADIFPPESVHENISSMVAVVRAISEPSAFSTQSRASSTYAREHWDTRALGERWRQLLSVDYTSADQKKVVGQ